MAILQGLSLGLLTAFLLGPVFFTLLKNAIHYGKNAGVATALGIIASDIIVISICFFATASLIDSIKTAPVVKLIGASILLFMGIRFIFWPSPNLASDTKTTQKGYLGYFVQGFLVNGVNPFVFVVWIGYITIGKNSYSGDELILFLAFILVGILVTDVIKSFLAHRIRPYLKPVYLKKAYQVIGIIIVGFAMRLVAIAFA